TPAKLPINRPKRRMKTILVVDDNQDMLEVLILILKDYGFSVLSAKDGEDGLKVFTDHRGSIDVVLSDIVMPKLNGVDMAKTIMLADPEARIVFMSGYDLTEEGRDFKTAWNVRWLHKPFAVEHLKEVIAELAEAT
ncbi:MAG TPA: response regulator, partial [Candidatus Hodarchaeales archaeon]|nr:response regulator [Candidatus Hodarchaeales archaeon]